MGDEKRMIYAHFLKTRTEELFNGEGYQVFEISDI
jgi:hypothetical protein